MSDGSVPLVNRIVAVPARSGVKVTFAPTTDADTTVESLDDTAKLSGRYPPLT